MAQPIPKKIKENKPELVEKPFNTLLVDGSNIMELSFCADKRKSGDDKVVGGIFQFLLQLRIIMSKGNFRYVYVFWDGDRSGQLRFNLLPEYKSNRDKIFNDQELSDYMKLVNENVRRMMAIKPEKAAKMEQDRKLFFWQRDIVMQCLEELYVRQCLCDETEADDFIGYYVTHKKPNERIVIMSNDRDLTQLISEDVIIYMQQKKKFINTKNHVEELGCHYKNILLRKMICGDPSDNIKGIFLLGEKTFDKYFGEIREKKVTLGEIIEKARMLNLERAEKKKKPFNWCVNLVQRVTKSSAGKDVFEVNKKIIDLKHPLMTDEAKELIENMMYAPLDPDGRSLSNLYKIIMDCKIDEFKDEQYFSNFFTIFTYLIEKEKKNQ